MNTSETPTRLKQQLRPRSVNGNLTCVAAIALFAVGFPAADYLLQDWGAIALIATRNMLGAMLLLVAWPLFEKTDRLRRAPWAKGIWIGFIGFGSGATLLLVTQSLTNAVTAALAAATMPVIAVALEVALDGRRLTRHFVSGVCLVLVGGFLATGLSPGDANIGLGALFGIAATTLFAWGSRATVKQLTGVSQYTQVVVTTTGMALFAIVAYFIAVMFSSPMTQTAALDLHSWGMLLIYAWVSLAISQTLWIDSVDKLGIGVASFHLNAAPFYVMLILLALGGSWSWIQALGAAILAAGVILAQRRPDE